MRATYWLIITRDGVRAVKRRPQPQVGEWVVRLTVDYPVRPEPQDLDITLPAQDGEIGVEMEPDEVP